MLVGTADVAALAARAPEVRAFRAEPCELRRVACLQLTAEMRSCAREAVLPPALHPTIPAVLILQVYDVAESEWGAFRFALARVACRSGVRARGFTTGAVVDGEAGLRGLRETFGFPAVAGHIAFRAGYDGASVRVALNAGTALASPALASPVLAIEALDPEPLGLDDVQYTGTLNLARTPRGLRLVQVESQTASERVERLRARLEAFDGAAFGEPLLVPARVIAASLARMTLTIPAVRFVCKPDELAFTGTEAVA